ncbi:hypothetical protein [Flavobacterium sp.]|uniref:hypothetical protein n=1 Tax=Flavobacterium sp. TaxID=239 RepID=UPI00286E121A|nr:hypothetical protein [Flavobacterium sp.]
MATLNEIEARIREHEKRLIELKKEMPNNQERIDVITSLIVLWENQKMKVIKSKL